MVRLIKTKRWQVSKLGVAAVAAGAFLAMFAAAKVNGPVLFRRKRFRGEATATVGAITERLLFAIAAGTPVVGFASLDRDWIG